MPDNVGRGQPGDVLVDADAEDAIVVLSPAPDGAVAAAGAGVALAGAELDGVGERVYRGGGEAVLLGALAELAPDVLTPAQRLAVAADGAGAAAAGDQRGDVGEVGDLTRGGGDGGDWIAEAETALRTVAPTGDATGLAEVSSATARIWSAPRARTVASFSPMTGTKVSLFLQI